ncbi:Predicted metal binding domain-containing protein [Nocardioides alpinus]|uniref:Predicted metal binding domain-containing protein n=1 Tax=Nocardioides alpinus TaxID=748909 RepID=A0A1I0VFD0_9ACTN|nr:putative metal-binding protein [Nocardioides alpinus]PKH37236.1 hypothetical protein CXG46_17300 [Nocardioides alpinus]SFA75031.1 Predicted metal binding domain-containing protein [Nocardioides alpinus]
MTIEEADTSSASAQSVDTSRGPLLVPHEVSRAKFHQQLERFETNRNAFARRGWLLLDHGDLWVEVGFLHQVPMASLSVPVMTACVRIDYWNFDLWPPSVMFVDPLTREPAPPLVRAPDKVSDTEVRDALIDGHPETGMAFLCIPGIREYHSHPQHNGDDWLLHRGLHEGDLAVLCDRIWRRMARNVVGLDIAVKLLPVGSRLDLTLLQGDPDALQRQMQAIQGDAVAAAPPMSPAAAEEPAHDASIGPLPSAVDLPGDDLAAAPAPEPIQEGEQA